MMHISPRVTTYLLPLACWLAAGSPQDAEAAESAVVSSPSKAVRAELSIAEGQLHFAVSRSGAAVIEPSPLRISVDGVALCEGVALGTVETYSIDETYPWRGVHSTARNHCRGARIAATHPASGTAFTIEVRAFDDGTAIRFHVPPRSGGPTSRVPDEITKFVLPAGSRVWFHDLEGHYEAEYESAEIGEVKAGQWLAPPLTFRLPGDGGYASITEADLQNYSGMALQSEGRGGLELALGHRHHVSYPFRLRYEDDIERMSRPARVEGNITTPWRVVIAGRDLNALVNSDIVPNLCPPPDAELFPEGVNTAWLKPGRAVWKYLDGGENGFEEVKNFSRWAGQLGFEYQVVEGFWSRWSDEQIREAVAYSRERGVGLWFWRHSRQLRTAEAREEFFARLERLGVVGAKIDFFDHEHKEVIDLYRALLADAARRRIMVNFHGANKPTGEARTWPNEMIREGVRGMEARRLSERARHNTILPFTRYLAGPGDYTPVVFGERRGDTTWAHQIATAAVFNEPLLTYGAHPQKLLDHPAVEMIKSIPSVWDETIALEGCEIGRLAAFARRHGDEWFLAVLNGPERRELQLPLSFLDDGQYDALVVADRAGNPEAVEISSQQNDKTDVLPISLDPGGGLIVRYRQVR